MNAINALVAGQIMGDLDEADALAQAARRFVDLADKDPFMELSDILFVQYFRLTKDLVRRLIDIVTPFMHEPQRAHRLTVTKKVLTALRFLGSGSYQGIAGSDAYVYVSQPTVSRCIHEFCDALNDPAILNEWIQFPRNMYELEQARNRFVQRHDFPGIVGCIDCTHVAIIAPTTASKIINACVVLHNMCIEANIPEDLDAELNIEEFGMHVNPPQDAIRGAGVNADLETGRQLQNHIVQEYFA